MESKIENGKLILILSEKESADIYDFITINNSPRTETICVLEEEIFKIL